MSAKTLITTVLAGAALTLGAQGATAGTTPEAMHEGGFDQAVAKSVALWMAEDGFDRAVAAKLAQQSSPIASPDAVDRYNAAILAQRSSGTVNIAMDDRLREPPPTSVTTSVTSSAREIEWPQIGFGIGALMAFGLFMAIRLTGIRQLSHR